MTIAEQAREAEAKTKQEAEALGVLAGLADAHIEQWKCVCLQQITALSLPVIQSLNCSHCGRRWDRRRCKDQWGWTIRHEWQRVDKNGKRCWPWHFFEYPA